MAVCIDVVDDGKATDRPNNLNMYIIEINNTKCDPYEVIKNDIIYRGI